MSTTDDNTNTSEEPSKKRGRGRPRTAGKVRIVPLPHPEPDPRKLGRAFLALVLHQAAQDDAPITDSTIEKKNDEEAGDGVA